MDRNKEIQEIVRKLFAEKKIDLFIGFKKFRTSDISHPFIAKSEADADKLIFDEYCYNNLAKFIMSYKKFYPKIGILAKPCDIRAVVVLMQEHQFSKEEVVVVGINCEGMVKRNGKEQFFKCRICRPVIPENVADFWVGDKSEMAKKEPGCAELEEFEKLSNEEKNEYWEQEFSKCIRCYACRKVCPFCYCEECIVEKNQPQWIDKSMDTVNNRQYHLMWIMHLAGRCVNCGACERACVVDIPLGKITDKLEKSVKERFDYTSGEDLNKLPPIGLFKPDDKENFIK